MKGRLTLAAYYSLTSAAMLLLVLWLVAVSGITTIPWLATCSGALFVAGAGRRIPSVARFLLRGLIAVGLFVGVARFRATGDLVTLFAAMLTGILPLTFFHRARSRGYWSGFTTLFLLALVALVGGDGLAEHLLFLLLCASAVFHLNAGHLFFHVGAVEAGRRELPRGYFFSFLGSVGLGTAFGIALFVLFPRSLQWYNPLALRSREATTGYSGQVMLDGSALRESTELAMTVESHDTLWLARAGPLLHFRGNTLRDFDGVRWSNPRRPAQPFRGPGTIDATTRAERAPRRITIYRELHTPTAVLYPGVLRDIDAPLPLLRGLFVDGAGTLRRRNEESIRYKYEIAFLPTPLGDYLPSARSRVRPIPFPGQEELTEYRRLPSGFEGGWFRDWARQVDVPPGADIEATLLALRRHFRGYRATYLHEGTGPASLESFLTRDRASHCEYFATAAALFLRSRGIPARLVLGYHGGQFNPVSSVLEVREANAHAWVEAFEPESGWIGFDPTPLRLVVPANTAWSRLQLRISAVKFWFQRYLVDYNTQMQRELIRDLILARSRSGGGRWSFPVPGARTLAVLAMAALLSAWTFRRRWRRKHRAGEWVPRYYRRFRARVRRQGYEKTIGESFASFHARLRTAGIDGALVEEMDRAIERDLYSRRPLDAEERRRLEKRGT